MSARRAVASATAGWRLDNSYTRLPEIFFSPSPLVPVKKPSVVAFNHPLAEALGLNGAILDTHEGAQIFAGNESPEGAMPIAQAYAGHQFGNFTILGDGRAILLGEQVTPGGDRFDIQLKGAGQTRYSRRGDGRATLGPMLREYIISEAMHALGIPTTRSLAVATTGQEVLRESPLPGAVLTRVAASHVRVGTFQFAANFADTTELEALMNYTVTRHYPSLLGAGNTAQELLKAVIDRQASLVAAWLHVGFIHGVMNTDNMAISGETIDYGPCAFMDGFDPATVFSSIDRQGRYAYGNQPHIAQWNLARFAETLLPLLDPDENRAIEIATDVIKGFTECFKQHWLAGMRLKLGIFNEEDDDLSLAESLLVWMEERQADYTNTFRNLDPDVDEIQTHSDDAKYPDWHLRWKARLSRQPQSASESREMMHRHNPAVIPRNHQVEAALDAAVDRGDFKVMERLLAQLAHPFVESGENLAYRAGPGPEARFYKTFCGT